MHETNITILGIFASIVLVFNAAVSFYTSSIEAFGGLDIYKIIFIFSLIGVIIISAIMGLLSYLEIVRSTQKTVNNKISQVKKPLKWVIFFLIVLMALIVISGNLSNEVVGNANSQSMTESTNSSESTTTPNIPHVGV